MKNISKLACLSLLLFGYDVCGMRHKIDIFSCPIPEQDEKELINKEFNQPHSRLFKYSNKKENNCINSSRLYKKWNPQLVQQVPYQSLACQVVEQPAQGFSMSEVKSPVTVMSLLDSPVYKKYQNQYTQNQSDVTLGASNDALLSQNQIVAATLSTGKKKAKKKKQSVHPSQDKVFIENEATTTTLMNSARLVASKPVLAAIVPQRSHAMQSFAGRCDQNACVGKVLQKASQLSTKQKISKKSTQEASDDDAVLDTFMEKVKIEKKEKNKQIVRAMMGDKSIEEFRRGLQTFTGIVNSLIDLKDQYDSLQALQDVNKRLAEYVAQGFPVINSIIIPLNNIKQALRKTQVQLSREGRTSQAVFMKFYEKECSQMLSTIGQVPVFDLSSFKDEE